MKKLVKLLVLLLNLVIIVIATRWWKPDNWHEPLIVIIGQVASLLGLYLDNSGNVSLTDFSRTNFDGNHEGSGNLKVKKMKDSDVKLNKP
jgi:hypothetical protein